MKGNWKYLLAVLSLGAVTLWLAIFNAPDKKLHLIACDVGQGDAILAVYGQVQILVDGGPGSEVVECIERHVPFWDKKIEVVFLTHPQNDHFGGLIEVLKNYQVEKFIATRLESGSEGYQVLKSAVGGNGCEVVNPEAGMSIRLDMIQLDIVWPSSEFLAENMQPVVSLRGTEGNAAISSVAELSPPIGDKEGGVLGSATTSRDPNDFSVVTILRFGEFDALLTGDINPEVTEDILDTGLVGGVEYIKVPHHGSKNGLTQELLDISSPEIAVISVGKNSYGHPHQETLDLLARYGLPAGKAGLRVLRTDEEGDVEIISDGEKFWINN